MLKHISRAPLAEVVSELVGSNSKDLTQTPMLKELVIRQGKSWQPPSPEFNIEAMSKFQRGFSQAFNDEFAHMHKQLGISEIAKDLVEGVMKKHEALISSVVSDFSADHGISKSQLLLNMLSDFKLHCTHKAGQSDYFIKTKQKRIDLVTIYAPYTLMKDQPPFDSYMVTGKFEFAIHYKGGKHAANKTTD